MAILERTKYMAEQRKKHLKQNGWSNVRINTLKHPRRNEFNKLCKYSVSYGGKYKPKKKGK